MLCHTISTKLKKKLIKTKIEIILVEISQVQKLQICANSAQKSTNLCEFSTKISKSLWTHHKNKFVFFAEPIPVVKLAASRLCFGEVHKNYAFGSRRWSSISPTTPLSQLSIHELLRYISLFALLALFPFQQSLALDTRNMNTLGSLLVFFRYNNTTRIKMWHTSMRHA